MSENSIKRPASTEMLNEPKKCLAEATKCLAEATKCVVAKTTEHISNMEGVADVIKNFVEKNSGEAEQGSEQWLKDREGIIGGSEVSTIEGCNTFSTIPALISQKVGLTSFNGNSATRWGNLFENVSELMFKTLFSADHIYSTGSIPHKTIKTHRYSPDGICVLPFNGRELITLLEFKSPYGSVPGKTVPKHYLPQVKAGLCTIDITDIGLFVNSMFRKCALKQLDFTTSYDTAYHRDTEKKLAGINNAISNGLVLLYITKEDIPLFEKYFKDLVSPAVIYDSDSDSDNDVKHNTDKHKNGIMSDNSDSESEAGGHIDDGTSVLYKIHRAVDEPCVDNLIDFGDLNREMFDQFLELYKPERGSGFISVKCVKPQINKAQILNESKNFVAPSQLSYIRVEHYLDSICKKYNSGKLIGTFVRNCGKLGRIPIGYLPWKMLRCSNIIVEKDPEYLDRIKDKMDNTIQIVADINRCSTMDDKARKFEEYFPENSITKNYFESKNSAFSIDELP